MRMMKMLAAAGLLGVLSLAASPAMANAGGMLSGTAGKPIAAASGDTGVVQVHRRKCKKWWKCRHRHHRRHWYSYSGGYYGGGWGPYGGYYSDYYYPSYRIYVGPRHRGWWRHGHRRRHGGISIGIGF